MTRTSSIPLLTAFFCLSTLAGCGKEAPKVKKSGEEDAPSAADNVKVELPPPPDFDEGKVAEKYEDGVWSVYGLRKELDANVKQGEAGVDIEVRGYVQDIYEPPVCPEGQQCPPGKQPHVWITDKPDDKGKKRAMMVVNYAFTIPEYDVKRWKDVPTVMMAKGQQYTFKGKFKRFSDTGFADARGLLDFVAYKDPKSGTEGWVAPPGAPWHPLEEAAEAERQKALIEKVNKNAAKNRGG
ncbi:MAG TPA: hypothetical protein VGB85_21765 [Nannocystis sp.]|jgi:hypothetical protein